MRISCALALVSCIASQAFAEKLRAPTCKAASAKKPAPSTVETVDWCNFAVGGLKGGQLRAGHSSVHLYRELGQPHDTISASLLGVVFGDLDGDKQNEAALVIERSTWIGGDSTPTSHSMTVEIYAMVKRAPTRIGSIPIPTDTPVQAISLGKGIVTVTSGKPKKTLRYRRDADDFVEVTP